MGKLSISPQVKVRLSLTKYGGINDSEWFAAWLLAAQTLESTLPDAFAFITEAVTTAS